MNSVILQLASPIIRLILLTFAVIVLLRGHNLPGGGFIAGLLAGLAVIFKGFAYSMSAIKDLMSKRSKILMSMGLLAIFLSFLPSIIKKEPLMTGLWLIISAGPLEGLKAGTPTLFDTGVFFTVTGVTLLFFVSLTKHQ